MLLKPVRDTLRSLAHCAQGAVVYLNPRVTLIEPPVSTGVGARRYRAYVRIP